MIFIQDSFGGGTIKIMVNLANGLSDFIHVGFVVVRFLGSPKEIIDEIDIVILDMKKVLCSLFAFKVS